MAKIIFKIFPQIGHHNATYFLAKELKDKGHEIIYVGLKAMEGAVRAQGFEYYKTITDIFPPFQPTKIRSDFLSLKIYKTRKELIKKVHDDFSKGKCFDEIVKALKPDLIIVDSPYVRHAIILHKFRIPFIIVESMVALGKNKFCPPLNSNIVPENSFLSGFFIEMEWIKYFVENHFRSLMGNPMPSNKLVRRLAKKIGFPIKMIDFNRYFHPGLKNIPELILSPQEFDFPHLKRNNQYFVGPAVNLERKDFSCDLKYLELINSLTNKNITVYCSFGSAAWRYKKIELFFDKLINIFKKYNDLNLILSIGLEMDYKRFKSLPSNIYIFQKVPQIDLLKKVDMMVTHGGMNSITECIMLGIPMLVYPGTSRIDQVGNAARVVYHKIGLKGDLKENEQQIENKINLILNSQSFKKNIETMRSNIYQNKSYEKGIDIIESYLSSKTIH